MTGGDVVLDLLDRSWRFWRLGMNAMGCISYQAFLNHKECRDSELLLEVNEAVRRGDFIRAADTLQYLVRPAYAGP